jgi:hypothetical protein
MDSDAMNGPMATNPYPDDEHPINQNPGWKKMDVFLWES